MANVVYNTAKNLFATAQLDWDDNSTTVIRLLLHDSTSTYTANPDHNFVSDVVGANGGVEMSGTGYTRKDVATRTSTKDTTDDRAELDAADITWTAINAGTAKAAIIYKQTGGDDTTPANDDLICYIDTGGFPIVTNGGDLTIQWSTNGIIAIA
jgi:hypothetical protein